MDDIILAFHSLVVLFTIPGRNSHPCWWILHPLLALTLAFLVISLLEVLLSTSFRPACWIRSLLGHQGVDLGL
jgi:hypothetical protein